KYGLNKLPCLEDGPEYNAHEKVLKLYSP
ncbi:MAG: glutamine amidotransferase, partial [Methanobacteriales archaeon HGW-Methanobacteriales-2]